MKIQVPDNLNPIDVIRRAGYGLVRDPRNPEQSFSRRLGNGIYPRFHVYLNAGNIINLHLDQKQASYQGYSAHSGEYDGEVVENEAARIESVINGLLNSPNEEAEPEKRPGFFSRFFG